MPDLLWCLSSSFCYTIPTLVMWPPCDCRLQERKKHKLYLTHTLPECPGTHLSNHM